MLGRWLLVGVSVAEVFFLGVGLKEETALGNVGFAGLEPAVLVSLI